MLDEGSRTSTTCTENAVTAAATAGTSSQASPEAPSNQRTSTPRVSPRTPRKRTDLPSKMDDEEGEGSLCWRRWVSPIICSGGPRRHAERQRVALATQQLAHGNQLMAGLLESMDNRGKSVERPSLPLVQEDDRASGDSIVEYPTNH